MTRVLSRSEFAASANELLEELNGGAILVSDGDRELAVLMSPAEYDTLRRDRGRRAIAAITRLSDAIHAANPTEEELHELERALDRKAS